MPSVVIHLLKQKLLIEWLQIVHQNMNQMICPYIKK